MSTHSALTLIRAMRVPFLVLAPVCVLLGISTALHAGTPLNPLDVGLVLLGAISAHVSVNLFNEYSDFRSGLDALTRRTPFSGGSGALIDAPGSVNAVWLLAAVTLGVTVLTGLYFTYLHGYRILPLGLAGILIILAYTPWLTRHPLLCLLAPGAGFGPLMVGGTHFALTGTYSGFAFYVSLVPFFLTSNLLLLNQLPDMQADHSIGRRSLPVVYGMRASIAVYGLFTTAAGVVILAGIHTGYIPRAGYLCLLPLSAALAAWVGAGRHGGTAEKLPPYLGLNVLAAIVTPLLLGVVLLTG